MTFLGKLLVIIQLVMSICFMALAGAVFSRQQAWNEKFVDATKSLEDREKQVAQTEQELSELKQSSKETIDRLTDQVTKLDRDLKSSAKTLALREADLQREIVEKETNRAKAKVHADEAEIRREEALTQTEINDKLNTQLNIKSKELQGMEKQLFDMRVERKKLVERYNEMLAQNALAKKALAANGLNPDFKAYANADVPPPTVDGEVKDTRKTAGREIVEVTIGSDDGVKDGTILFIYRGGEGQRNKYLGEIRLELVTPDKAVGVVINRAKNGQIEKGDYVTTKL